jgi:uncharacterized protein
MLPTREPPADQDIIDATQRWVVKAVIGLNLCPFAKAEHVHGRIRYVVSRATTRDDLLAALHQELVFLNEADPARTETTLVMMASMLEDFFDFNGFLDAADSVVETLDLDGVIQIASFHPQYQFADAGPDDIENYSNRSPWPTLHLIREESIDRAVAAFPDAADIYGRNMAVLRQLGIEGWKKRMS